LEANFNPRAVDTLAREAALARETWDFLETQAEAAWEALSRKSGGRGGATSLPAAELAALHPALRRQVLRRALRESLGSLEGVGAAHIASLDALCLSPRGDGEAALPRGVKGARRFGQLVLQKDATSPRAAETSFFHELPVPGECFVPEIAAGFRCAVVRTPADMRTAGDGFARRALLDLAALPGRLAVRSRQPGDRYGGAGRRKVKKLLVDGKIPLERRATLPMLAAGDAVVWIPGFRPARGYAARPGAAECLSVEMFQESL